MLIKTHLIICVFFILLFLPVVNHDLVFIIVALIATYLPDVDSRFSTIGHRKIARVLQWFTRHRGMIHSFTFLLVVTLFLVLFFPVVSFGFFLGYGLHLFADSFTREGIRLFYPLKNKSCGRIRTGSRIETGIFVVFLMASICLLLNMLF